MWLNVKAAWYVALFSQIFHRHNQNTCALCENHSAIVIEAGKFLSERAFPFLKLNTFSIALQIKYIHNKGQAELVYYIDWKIPYGKIYFTHKMVHEIVYFSCSTSRGIFYMHIKRIVKRKLFDKHLNYSEQ